MAATKGEPGQRWSSHFASCWTCQMVSGGPETTTPRRLNPIFLPALKRFHGPLHYQKELEDIQRENFALGGEKAKKPWELFADRSIRWQLIAVICLTMGQQLSGINAVSAKTPLGRSLHPPPAAGRFPDSLEPRAGWELPTPQLGARLFLAAAALQAPLAKITEGP